MIQRLGAKWRAAILVCGKCERRLGKGGFGADGKKRLSKLLRKAGGGGKGRKAGLGVISTGCMKVCPKGAVVVIDGARPRDWLIVEGGTPLPEVEARLGLSTPTRPGPVADERDTSAMVPAQME